MPESEADLGTSSSIQQSARQILWPTKPTSLKEAGQEFPSWDPLTLSVLQVLPHTPLCWHSRHLNDPSELPQ